MRLAGLGLLLLAAGPSADAEDAAAPDGDGPLAEIVDCVRGNFPASSSVQEVELVVTDRAGGSRTLGAKVWWSRIKKDRSRALIRVQAPEDVRGMAVLLIERDGGSDVFMYSPEMRKVRRITSHTLSGSLFGSHFSYEDFASLQGLAMGSALRRLPVSDLDGRAVDAFEQVPDAESGSQYARVVSYVTQDTCLPVRSDMYERGGDLRKVMHADLDDLIEQKGVRIPRSLEMTDHLAGGSTRLRIKSMEVDAKIPRKIFDLTTLESGRE